jgi:AraC family transcriptional regulator
MDGTPTSLFSADEPLLTSAGRAWTGLTVEEHYLPPTEFPERTADSHLIALHLRPARLVWFLGGHPQTKRMTRGSLDIVPRGTLLGGYSQDETESLMLALDPSLVERVASEMGATYHVELIRNLGIRDPQIEHICLALKAELETDCPSGRLYGDALAIALSAHLLARHAVHVPDAHGHGGGLPACKLRRVIEYINDNLAEDLTLAELACVAGMSAHYFSRAFKQTTGLPPHRYVTNCRVEKAKRLLADGELPLVEVGFTVGFQNQSHFTTLFHKLTGVTPKVYRDGT